MVSIGFAVPELRVLGDLVTEAIVLPVYFDERPLQGAVGLIDWRLAGFVAEALALGPFSGERGERLLTPGRPKLQATRVMLFGAGRRADFGDGTFDDVVCDMLDALRRSRTRSFAVCLPGRSDGRVASENALVRFLYHLQNGGVHDDVLLIEPVEAQATMEPLLRREQARYRALSRT